MTVIDVMLSLIVWSLVFAGLWRGYHRTGLRLDRYGVATWTVFIGIAFVFTFRVAAVQPVIDGALGGYPVTFLLSLLAVLLAISAYSLSLRWLAECNSKIDPLPRTHAYLLVLAPVVALLFVMLMAIHLSGGLSSFQTQYVAKWLLEAYAFLQAGLVFVPVNFLMARQEKVFPMRVKHLATLVLCSAFALSAALSALTIPFILSTGKVNPGPSLIPRGQIAVVCLGIILLPHRWIAVILLPYRLYCFSRLSALDKALRQRIQTAQISAGRQYQPRNIDMAIYAKVIDILDNYRLVETDDVRSHNLVEQIQSAATRSVEYDSLVEELCRVSW